MLSAKAFLSHVLGDNKPEQEEDFAGRLTTWWEKNFDVPINLVPSGDALLEDISVPLHESSWGFDKLHELGFTHPQKNMSRRFTVDSFVDDYLDLSAKPKPYQRVIRSMFG